MTKITGYAALTATQSDDVLPIVDVHDTSMAASGTTKQITVANLLAGSSSLTPAAVKTSAYNAAAGDFVPVDTTSGNVTVTLPTAPADKTQIAVKMVITAAGHIVTIAAGGSDVFNKTGGSTSMTLTQANQGIVYQYKATGAIWYVLDVDAGSPFLTATADNQGSNGVLVIANPALNTMAAGNQANSILSSGINGSPNAISGVVNYSGIGAGYDNNIETTSVGVLFIAGAHCRIVGATTHGGILWGSYHTIANANYSGIVCGTGHSLVGDNSVVGGGANNVIGFPSGGGGGVTITGGTTNVAAGNFANISGGTGNWAFGSGAAINGGGSCVAYGTNAAVGGGTTNKIGVATSVANGAMTAGSTTLTSASNPFVAPYIAAGSAVIVLGAGPSGAQQYGGTVVCKGTALYSTIASVTNSGSVVLADAASTTVSGATVILLSANNSFGQYATITGGFTNTIASTGTSKYSVIDGGRSNTLNADYGSIIGGQSNVVSQSYCVATGFNALGNRYGGLVRSNGMFVANGDNQQEKITLWAKIVNTATAVELMMDGVGGVWRLSGATQSAYSYKGTVLAKQSGGVVINTWDISGVFTMGANAAATLLRVHTETAGIADSATAALTVTADTTHGAINVMFTDSAAGALTWYVAADLEVRKIAG